LCVQNIPEGHALLEGDYSNDNYVDLDNMEVFNKTVLQQDFDKLSITADGIDFATLTGLPIPCTVNVDGNSYYVTDGTFEFTAISIGDYEINVNEIAYFRKDWIINAH
jgi:hypothetical protein